MEIDLDDDLRAQVAPGQRYVRIERKVDDGLFGSGLGTTWERLPVEATFGADEQHRPTLFVDPNQLRAAIGSEAADRVLARSGVSSSPETPKLPPPPLTLPIMEMRIGASADGGVTPEHREVTEEEVQEVCPRYSEFKDIAEKAAKKVDAEGGVDGSRRGQAIHKLAADDIRIIASISDELEARGILELHPETAFRDGKNWSRWHVKGSSVFDVLELRRDHKTVCVYDFKTGNASFPNDTIIRYLTQAGMYAQSVKEGYTRILVIPIYVDRRP